MLMADDMMDGSVTRRGNPCWYRSVGQPGLLFGDLISDPNPKSEVPEP